MSEVNLYKHNTKQLILSLFLCETKNRAFIDFFYVAFKGIPFSSAFTFFKRSHVSCVTRLL